MMARIDTVASADDSTAFEHLLRDNQARLVRIARQFTDGDGWQDLLQEIHLQLWRSRDGFRGQAQSSTWVYRVAMNTAISHRRGQRDHGAGRDHDVDPDSHVASHGAGDALALLQEFLTTLDPVNRAVLILDLDGLDRQQIADVLGLSTNAVAVRMTRLRQAFEQRYLEGV